MPANEPITQTATPSEPQALESTEPPAAAMPATTPDPKAAALAVDAFSTKTLGALLTAQQSPENLFYSPYSLFGALAMTSAGASGHTLTQMQALLGLSDHADFAALSEALGPKEVPQEQRVEGAGDPMTLKVANRIWVAKGLEVTGAFAKVAKTHYGTTPEQIDFSESVGCHGSNQQLDRQRHKRPDQGHPFPRHDRLADQAHAGQRRVL